MTALVSYILSAMIAFVPPQSADVARYEAIASDVVLVAGEDPAFAGESGTARTALLMTSIASLESFYRADVDDFTKLGDAGKSKGLMQVWLERGETCRTRVECLRIGLSRIHRSFHDCKGNATPDLLAEYASGRCDRGLKESRNRMGRALRYWSKTPFVDGAI